MAAVARGLAEDENERIDQALRLSPGERMLLGLKLGGEAPWSAAHLAEVDARADGQMEIARRRIAMGLGSGKRVGQ